ncbi:MAG: FAD-binding protein [Chitinophagales bacterium]
MAEIFEIELSPEKAADMQAIARAVDQYTKGKYPEFRILRKSIDARSRNILVRLRIEAGDHVQLPAFALHLKNVHRSEPVHIIGAGPAGLFAALACIEIGLKPIVFERGKDVRARRRDLAKLNRNGVVDPDSNYCFGEGGAGTYSDGKLYTRSDKRGDIFKVLQTFVHFGGDPDILFEAHPHIGTNKLPGIIEKMREAILQTGGEIHFGAKLTGIQCAFNSVQEITINGDQHVPVRKLILATGHSARDIYTLLHAENITLEAKPFALGVRIEHPQDIIDSMQYKCTVRDPFLPPASYNIVKQVEGAGVYSFCMCPGGIIAPCATDAGEVVTNGWSPSKRNNPFANSGFVTTVELQDTQAFAQFGPLCGMYFQAAVEKRCFAAGGGHLRAPAQRLVDFIENKISADLPACSYKPGIVSADLHGILPHFIALRLQHALKQMQRSHPKYITNEAVLVATESRTSSPVRIPRDVQTLEHIRIKGLYPCAEGAGYAGGIVSAAMDGIRIVKALINA